ncbi:MAG TPA: Smr/MutS family protein [Devosiaceae bacterium]|nr:Smr/MutS family protein [Devosiaceae bacterium]
MSKRVVKKGPPLRDWYLWAEVKKTVTPLRPEPEEPPPPPPPLPVPEPKQPPVFNKGAKWRGPTLPSYEPRTSPKPPTEAGRQIEPRMRRRLVRGQIEIDGTIDLHGMRQDEARAALQRFVASRLARGDRTLLVITGKGLKKTDEMQLIDRGILRTMLPIWLSEPALAPMIAGWDVAAQGHGGEGAYYVRLRRMMTR